jgi:hypothetical protein
MKLLSCHDSVATTLYVITWGTAIAVRQYDKSKSSNYNCSHLYFYFVEVTSVQSK